MKDCKTCIWFGKEKPGQCGNYLCRNQSEYDPRTGVEEADSTADVRGDVRARWKGAGLGDYSCSWCGEVVSGNNHNFCPNCGAKMDGE